MDDGEVALAGKPGGLMAEAAEGCDGKLRGECADGGACPAGGGRMMREPDGLGAVMGVRLGFWSEGGLALGGDGGNSEAAGLWPLRSRSMRLPEACLPLDALIQVQLMLSRIQLSQGLLWLHLTRRW